MNDLNNNPNTHLVDTEDISNNQIDQQDTEDDSPARFRRASRKTWVQRTFSKMEKDSQRSAILMLVICAFGGGIFAYFHPLNKMGIFYCSIFTLIIIRMFLFSIDITIYAFKKAPEAKSLNEIIEITGGKVLRKVYDLLFILFLYLIVIAIIIMICKIVYYNIGIFIYADDFPSEESLAHFCKYSSYIVGVLFFLMMIQPSIDVFQKYSIICFLIFFGMVAVILIEFPSRYRVVKSQGVNMIDTEFIGFFESLGIIFYSFNVTCNFHSIATTVSKPTRRRILKIFRTVFDILSYLFLFLGLFSYLAVGQENADVLDLYIFREAHGTDILMKIARTLYIFNCLICGVLNAFPLKILVIEMITSDTKSKIANYGVSLLIIVTSSIIASLFTNIKDYMGIAGCVCCITTCFTIPGIIALRIGYAKDKFSKFLLLIFTFGSFVLCIICTIVTVISLIEEKKKHN